MLGVEMKKMKNLVQILMLGLLIVATSVWAQSPTPSSPPAGGKIPTPVEEVKASDLPVGDFSLDDVEELPLPTEEEGGVQVDGKSYLPQPKEPYQPVEEIETPKVVTPQPAPQPAPPMPTPAPAQPPAVAPLDTPSVPPAPTELAAPPTAPPSPAEEAIQPAETTEAPATTPSDVPSDVPVDAPSLAAPNTPSTSTGVVAMAGRLGPEGGQDIYGITGGDNLWDICQKMFGDPFLWPRLWAMNQYITNPHLIFPGDQLRFMMGTTTQAPQLQIATAGEQPAAPPTPELMTAESTVEAPTVPQDDSANEKLETVGDTSSVPELMDASVATPGSRPVEVRNYAFVTPREYDASGRITHSGEEKFMLSTGDTVYMQFEDMKAVREGDYFHTFETVSKVKKPNRMLKNLGYLVHLKSKIRVTKVDPKVITGVIEDSWEISSRDDRLIPYQPLVRRVMPKEQSKKMDGVIVESSEQLYMISQRDIAFVNLGKSQGLEEGDLLFVVRQGDGVLGQREGLPDVTVGQLTVIETMDDTAIVLVNWSRSGLQVGDRVTTRL